MKLHVECGPIPIPSHGPHNSLFSLFFYLNQTRQWRTLIFRQCRQYTCIYIYIYYMITNKLKEAMSHRNSRIPRAPIINGMGGSSWTTEKWCLFRRQQIQVQDKPMIQDINIAGYGNNTCEIFKQQLVQRAAFESATKRKKLHKNLVVWRD